MNQPNGTAVSSRIDGVEQQMICPHCFGFIRPITTDDDTICNNCNRKITEEDLEYVFTEDTTITG